MSGNWTAQRRKPANRTTPTSTSKPTKSPSPLLTTSPNRRFRQSHPSLKLKSQRRKPKRQKSKLQNWDDVKWEPELDRSWAELKVEPARLEQKQSPRVSRVAKTRAGNYFLFFDHSNLIRHFLTDFISHDIRWQKLKFVFEKVGQINTI